MWWLAIRSRCHPGVSGNSGLGAGITRLVETFWATFRALSSPTRLTLTTPWPVLESRCFGAGPIYSSIKGILAGGAVRPVMRTRAVAPASREGNGRARRTRRPCVVLTVSKPITVVSRQGAQALRTHNCEVTSRSLSRSGGEIPSEHANEIYPRGQIFLPRG